MRDGADAIFCGCSGLSSSWFLSRGGVLVACFSLVDRVPPFSARCSVKISALTSATVEQALMSALQALPQGSSLWRQRRGASPLRPVACYSFFPLRRIIVRFRPPPQITPRFPPSPPPLVVQYPFPTTGLAFGMVPQGPIFPPHTLIAPVLVASYVSPPSVPGPFFFFQRPRPIYFLSPPGAAPRRVACCFLASSVRGLDVCFFSHFFGGA